MSDCDFSKRGEYALRLGFKTRKDAPNAVKPGEEIAWEQFPLEGSYARTAVSDKGEMKVSSDNKKLRVSGEDFKAVFDRRTGWLESYEFGSQTLIEGPMKLSLRRPPPTTKWARSSQKSSRFGAPPRTG